MSAIPSQRARAIPSMLRDARVLQIIGQIIFAIFLIAVASAIWTSILTSLQSKNLTPSTNFLTNRAGFDISEHPEWYSSESSYGDAFRVGLENSLRIIGIGLVLTTILGIIGGIFLLSTNWLIRTLTRSVVEILRNTPLLVQLIAWYFVAIFSLPLFNEAVTFPQEAIVPVSVRILIYALGVIVLWMLLRNDLPASPRRILLWNGMIGAVVALEIANHWVAQHPDGLPFAIYAVVSLIVIAAAWLYAPAVMRFRLLGLSIGQLVGGLLFYFGILPNSNLFRVEMYPAIMLSKRGLVLPEILPTAHFTEWMIFVVIGVVLAGIIWVYCGRITETTGQPMRRTLYAVVSIVAFAVIGWALVGITPQPATIPVVQEDDTTAQMSIEDAQAAGLLTQEEQQLYSQAPFLYIPPVQKISPAGIVSGLVSGTQITPEYVALLVGLVVYTAAFIAEIVRAGILAVPHGQIEAARALGLGTSQTLRIIILPQALRVIIPPLGNQYLNLAKNSSLAIAVAYADLVLVTTTIMNQSESVTGITMIMLTYLAISLLLSAFINLVNRRFQLVTR